MSKQILIDSSFGLVRTAIAEGHHLLDYYEESLDLGRVKGNIYRGVVKRVDGNIQAAFIRFGIGRDGFLPLRDADAVTAVGGMLRVGDPVLVQVIKDEVGEKGAALTVKLSLSGRYLVLVPGRAGDNGISSRIGDEERAKLKKILGEMQYPENTSVILRTAALDQGLVDLQTDLDRLSTSYTKLMEEFGEGKEPALLYREATPALRYLREYYSPDVVKIWVNDVEVFEQCRRFFSIYEEKSLSKVLLSKDGPMMFQKLGLEPAVSKLTQRKVVLPSGANFVIDEAEALVAIDVNSAKVGGRSEDGPRPSGLEATAFQVNREAAVEICLQLRLRDLGGIIVIDFIDMEEERHRRQIEDLVRRNVSVDKAKIKVYDISPLGTMQISRQRIRKVGPNFSRQACESCEGKGWHPHPAVGAFTVLRRMEERLLARKTGSEFKVSVPYPVANELLNDFRDHILLMEKRFTCGIRVTALASPMGEAIFETPAFEGDKERYRENANRSRENTGRHSRSRRNPRFGGEPNRHRNQVNPDSNQPLNNPSENALEHPIAPGIPKAWVQPIPEMPKAMLPLAQSFAVQAKPENIPVRKNPGAPEAKTKPVKKKKPLSATLVSRLKPSKSQMGTSKATKTIKVSKTSKPLKPSKPLSKNNPKNKPKTRPKSTAKG